MQKTFLAVLVLLACAGAGCGPSNYAYRFDIADPGAHNTQRNGERDTIEDADIRAEILADPGSFQAILLDITNKTNDIIQINWNGIVLVDPFGAQTALRPDTQETAVEPNGRVVSRLLPFVLPTRGSAASQYDNQVFELVVPMLVRGQPREYRWHLQAHVSSL